MLYRVDTFTLPPSARNEFVEQATRTLARLREQPGYIRNLWLEKVAGAGPVDVVTIVEWQDEDSVRAASQVVQAFHREAAFDAAAFAAKHGIVESKAVYAERAEG